MELACPRVQHAQLTKYGIPPSTSVSVLLDSGRTMGVVKLFLCARLSSITTLSIEDASVHLGWFGLLLSIHVLTPPVPRTKGGTVSSVCRYHVLPTPTTTAPTASTLLKRCVRYGRFGMECSVYMSLVLVLQIHSGMVQCVFLWGVCAHWAFTGME
jgi:hypothetical protein